MNSLLANCSYVDETQQKPKRVDGMSSQTRSRIYMKH